MQTALGGHPPRLFEGLPENVSRINNVYQRSSNVKFISKLAITLVAKWDNVPLVISGTGQLDVGTIGCQIHASDSMAKVCFLPSSIFPILKPIAFSVPFP